MGDIRDQLQTLTGASLKADQISAAGGKAFVSMNATRTQKDLTEVVAFWQGIHVPTYGMPIPGSGKTTTGSDSLPTVLSLNTNETAYVCGLSLINNNSTDTASVTISVGNASVWTGDIAAGASAIVVGAGQLQPFFLVQGLNIDIAATGTTPGDVAFTCAYGLSVQG